VSQEVPAALRTLVRDRARGRCEYCLLHEEDAWVPHEPDHVIATKHRGRTEEANLAWTCMGCNRHKGTDVASVEQERVVRLFHPRRDRWARHFRLHGALILGRTAVGRVTMQLLQFNRTDRVRMRRILIAARCYPR
jgi:5-methylcytosine-specific restriction endonuclease McrA